MCRWPLHSLTPSPANYRPHLSHFWANMWFSRSQLSHLLFMYLPYIRKEQHLTFHLQYKHSGTSANRKYEELSYPKTQKMCDPILVPLLKMWPIIVKPVVKMRLYPAPHQPLIRKYPPPRGHLPRTTDSFSSLLFPVRSSNISDIYTGRKNGFA